MEKNERMVPSPVMACYFVDIFILSVSVRSRGANPPFFTRSLCARAALLRFHRLKTNRQLLLRMRRSCWPQVHVTDGGSCQARASHCAGVFRAS